jgi:hypothetical protein
MSAHDEPPSEFEKRTRVLLQDSVSRVDGRVRSRLNQARHAALDAMPGKRRSFLQREWLTLSGTVAAAVFLAVVLWTRTPDTALPVVADATQTSFDDLDLLADADALDLIEEDDDAFLEWAAAQEAGEGVSG